MDIVIRPEVQLGTCPQDGGHMFRQYAETPQTWLCGQCGHVTEGDPSQTSQQAGPAAA